MNEESFSWGDKEFKVSEKQLKRAFVSARINRVCNCKNRTILIDRANRLLECSECGALLDPFEIVLEMSRAESRYIQNMEYLEKEKEELEKWQLNNRMGKTLRELASNIRLGRIPLCPHCRMPFELEKINGFTSKEYAIALFQQKMLEGKK